MASTNVASESLIPANFTDFNFDNVCIPTADEMVLLKHYRYELALAKALSSINRFSGEGRDERSAVLKSIMERELKLANESSIVGRYTFAHAAELSELAMVDADAVLNALRRGYIAGVLADAKPAVIEAMLRAKINDWKPTVLKEDAYIATLQAEAGEQDTKQVPEQ